MLFILFLLILLEVNRFDIPGPDGNYVRTFINGTIPQDMWTITFQGATINFVMTYVTIFQYIYNHPPNYRQNQTLISRLT
jgi:hypothetical protein